MIKWLKDVLGVNRYVVQRLGLFDKDWHTIGRPTSRSNAYRLWRDLLRTEPRASKVRYRLRNANDKRP